MNKWVGILLVLLGSHSYGQHAVPADGRFNFNLKYDVKGLDFILRLRPLTYQFDLKKLERQLLNSDASHAVFNFASERIMMTRRLGFIAQDVEEAAQQSGFQFSGLNKPSSRKEFYSLSYESFVVPLVKAVQEQQEIITEQENNITQQKKRIDQLEKDLSSLTEKLDTLLNMLEKQECSTQ
jgi:uncharacterized coiled-coil protein SlyX